MQGFSERNACTRNLTYQTLTKRKSVQNSLSLFFNKSATQRLPS